MSGVGIMQGRLVPPINGRLQCFPASRWMDEFPLAAAAGLEAIEWVYDVAGALRNPLSSDDGRVRIRQLAGENAVRVLSVCADYFMERALLRGEVADRAEASAHLRSLLSWAQSAGIERIVLPFVDQSAIESNDDLEDAVTCLKALLGDLRETGIELHLETSLPPRRFSEMLSELPHPFFRVNYDCGNSASLGFRPREEFAAYGDRIGSVHIKDRVRGGGSVTLGTGDTDFGAVFGGLRDLGYSGPFILQAARGEPGREVDWARRNREFVQLGWARNMG